MTMTPDAKSELSKTIRKIREHLLENLHDANERAYRLGVPIAKAKLNEEATIRRQRMEEWIDEQIRAETGEEKRDAMSFRKDIEKQAAYTFLNRIVILRLMEAWDLRGPAVATKGWDSKGYKDFRQLARSLVQVDTETEGFGFLLKLIFEDLATDLPGLYGSNGLADQVPIPPATMRFVIESLDEPVMDSCWTDDMTLGWVYQYWNDPEREALDAKINDGGKIEPHEIASKTQMFTERYMVDWLLQNSLGPMWLAMCKKHEWTPEAQSSGTLDELEKRRVEWRAKRDAGEVELTDLMPLHTDLERQWAYYVPQPIPDDAVEHANDSVRDLKILDPAVGSGHFLVAAFDLLHALYQEEARHRGVDQADLEDPQGQWSDQGIVERILEHNLNGIDLDSRAVQIAAAALWMKAKLKCESAQPANLNLVASNLGIARLPHSDPALVELRRAVEEETGIPANLTNQIIEALQGADHLGSLLKVDAALDEAISQYEKDLGWENNAMQLKMFPDGKIEQEKLPFGKERMKANLLSGIEVFLEKHSTGSELGLRLRGEELAAGVRFLRLNKQDEYDLVVANPPYQGTSKMSQSKYVETVYPSAKADLFAAFLLRGLQLVRPHGLNAMLTMRNWMFIKQFSSLRRELVEQFDIRALGDFDKGAFESMTTSQLISVCLAVIRRSQPSEIDSVAIQPTAPGEKFWSRDRTELKRAAVLVQRGQHAFSMSAFSVVPDSPLVYWWPNSFFDDYEQFPLLGDSTPTATAQSTGDNPRFRRCHWELTLPSSHHLRWHSYVGGADGAKWLEPVRLYLNWAFSGLEIKLRKSKQQKRDAFTLASEDYFNRVGITIPKIGSTFGGRMFRVPSIFGDAAPSIFPSNLANTLCLLNSTYANDISGALNPTVNFGIEDAKRLPLKTIANHTEIYSAIVAAFEIHESHREPSVEFRRPGISPWRHAQEWAQGSIDRPSGKPLTPYVEELDPELPTDHISFAVGVALGRFGPNGQGILNPKTDDLANALPYGILFLDSTHSDDNGNDSLGHPASKLIHETWKRFGAQIAPRASVKRWLKDKFFKDIHRQMYENRPIHWPLSSTNRTFVAFVNIHRFNAQTLSILLADHLGPALTRLDGELQDLKSARQVSDKSASSDAEQRYTDVRKWREELVEFMASILHCAEKGPQALDPNKPDREVDSQYDPNLDDGVMVNSSALWPLLESQWKDPKKWWKDLAAAKGKKDYDWSYLALRYFPGRVDKKCKSDPSYSVAHGCFWKHHPSVAWKWELRLQDEFGPDFRIEEGPFGQDGGHEIHRAAYLRDNPSEATEAVEKEVLRRLKDIESLQEMTILDTGLWSVLPEECWELETSIIKKQESEFRLVAPDEKKARKDLLKEKPDLKKKRKELLDKYKSLFADEPDEEVTA